MPRNSFITESRPTSQNPALEMLIEARRKFVNFVHASVYDVSDAEEIVQRVSVKIVVRAETLRDPSKAEAWIYRLLRNEIADHFRREAAQSKRTEALPEQISSSSSLNSESPRKTCPCALDEIAKLRDNYSDALRAMEMNDEAVAAYAARRGISANNAMVLLHRARKALRQRLESRCANCAGAGCFDCSCEA